MTLLLPWWFLLLHAMGCHGYLPRMGRPWNGYEFHTYPHPAKKPPVPRDIMVDVINNLGLKLLAIHNEYNENNIAISPYGALSVLIALGEGLEGDAVYEIQQATHIPNDISVIRVGLRDIHRHLKSYFIPKEGFLAGLTLNHENVTLRPSYVEILQFYGYDTATFNIALYPQPDEEKPHVTTDGLANTTPQTTTEIGRTDSMDMSTETTVSKTFTPTMPSVETTTDTRPVPTTMPSLETTTVTPRPLLTTMPSLETTTITTVPDTTTEVVSTKATTLVPDITTILAQTTEQKSPETTTTAMTTSTTEKEVSVETTTNSVTTAGLPATEKDTTTTTSISTTTSLNVQDETQHRTTKQVSATEAITTELRTSTTEDITGQLLTQSTEVTTNSGITQPTTINVPDTTTASVLTTSTEPMTTNDLTDVRTSTNKPSTLTIFTSSIESITVTSVNPETSTVIPADLTTVSTTAVSTEKDINVNEIETSTVIPAIITSATAVSTDSDVNEVDSTDSSVDDVGFGGISKRNVGFVENKDMSNIVELNMKVNQINNNDDYGFRRSSRSVIDYLIARYYDDPFHFHNTYVPYVPDDRPSFLVHGKYREYNINFMKYDTVLPFHYEPHLDALALTFPLDSTKYYLLLLLPVDETGIDKLICDLRLNGSIKYIINNLKYTRVFATIPSFMLKGYVTLTPSFQKLGIRRVFEPRQADFTPMTSQMGIYVTNIEQAITVTIKNYMDPANMPSHRNFHHRDPVHFKADHPFLYFVIDSEIHVTLMAGKIVNPLNSRIS